MTTAIWMTNWKGVETYDKQICRVVALWGIFCVQILWLHPTIARFGPPSCSQLYTDFGQTSLQWVKEYAENINDLQGSKKNQRIWASLYNACQRLGRNQFRKCHANMLSIQDYLWRDLTIRVMSASMFCLIKALGKPARNNSGFSLTLSSCCESLRT